MRDDSKRTRRIAAALAVMVFVAAGAWSWSVLQRQRLARETAAAELAAEDLERAAQIREESKAQRDIDAPKRLERRDARVYQALTQLQSNQPIVQCDAALLIGRVGSKAEIPPLVDLLSASASTSVRICAAGALVDLGEKDRVLATYGEWATSDDADLRAAAITGFGDIGSSATDVALPSLSEAIKSPLMNVRYLAVRSLEKLGPGGVPLLKVASNDADHTVREEALRALRATDGRK